MDADEVRRLLETMIAAPTRFGMAGPERALLYRLAIETGLRVRELKSLKGIEVIFPSMELCTDNGAMVAGLGYQYLKRGVHADLDLNAYARVPIFRKTSP